MTANYEIITIPLDTILQDRTPDNTTDEFLVCNDFLLAYQNKHLSEKSVDYLLDLHPIQVISVMNGKYRCVGGRRSLSIARDIYCKDKIIRVTLVKSIKPSEIQNMLMIDLFLCSVCFGIKKPDWLHKLINSIPEEIRRSLFVAKHGTSKLSQMLHVSKETVRKWKIKTKI